MITLQLLNNLVILLALGILYSYLTRRFESSSFLAKVLSGLLFGAFSIIGMLVPVILKSGVIFDGRSVILAVAGLFGGPIVALISAALALCYRTIYGGDGLITGLLIILSSSGFGVIYHYIIIRNKKYFRPFYIYLFGIIVHITMLLLMLTLPFQTAIEILEKISATILIFYPLATLFLAILLQDMERRNNSTKSLTQSEKKYRSLFESMAQGVTYQDSEGRIISANPAAEKILGLSLEQMQEKTSVDPSWKSIHEDGSDFPGDTHPSTIALQTGRVVNDVIMGVFNPIQNDYRWIKINAIPQFLNGAIKPFQVFTTFDDVTNEKKAELSLKENEHRYIKAQQLGKVGNWEYNLQTKHFWASEEARRIFGFDPYDDNFTTEFVEGCIPDRVRVHQALIDLIEKGKEYNLEYVVQPKNGDSPRIANSIAELIRDHNGKPQKVMGVILDITERKQAEEELRMSEAHFRSLMDNVQGFVLYRLHDDAEKNEVKVKLVSQSIKKILGVTDPFNLNEWFKNIHPDDLERVKEANTISFNEGKPFDQVMRIYHSDKKNCSWVQAISYPVLAPDEKSKYFNGIIIDITEEKNAEQELKESEEKYKTLVESSHDLIWSVDEKGTITFLNKAAKLIYGYEPEELIGKSFFEFIPKDQYEKDVKIFTESLSNGANVVEYDSQFIHKDGHIVYLKANSTFLKDEYGNIIGTTGTSKDITKQLQTQEQLRREEIFIKTLLENQPTAVVACDTQGRLVLFNKAAKKWHGVDILNIPTSEWAEYYGLYDENGKKVLDTKEIPLVKALAGEVVSDYVMVIKSKNQEERIVSCNGTSFFDDSGNKLGAVIIMNDITEQKRYETKLSRSEFLLSEMGRIAKVGGWDLDLVTMEPYFTEETFRIYELPIGKPPKVEDGINFYAPEARDLVQKVVQEAIQYGKSYDIEVPFITAKGNRIWVRTMGVVQMNDGKAIRLHGAIQDITEQKRIDELFRLNESILSVSQEIAKVGGWQWDVEKQKMYWTDETYNLHDIEKNEFEPGSSELIQKSLECYIPEDKEKIRSAFYKCVNQGESYDDILEFKTAKGRKLWIRTTAKAQWENNKIIKVTGVLQDITELIENSLKLEESESRYIKAQKLGKVGNWEYDIQSRTFWGSNETKRIFGFNKEQSFFSYDEVKNSIPEWERVYNTSRDLIEKNKNYNIEYEIIPRNGESLINVSAIAELLCDKNGNPLKVIGVIQDISEQKKLLNELIDSREQLRSLAAHLSSIREDERKNIAREIHDELGQILTSIKLNLGLLNRQIKTNSGNLSYKLISAELVSISELIDKSIKNIRKLISQLRPEYLDNLGLIPAVENYLENFKNISGIDCILNNSIENEKFNSSISIILFRIIQESITNVARHSKASKVTVNFTYQEGKLILTIEDNGVGFVADKNLKIKSFGLIGMQERASALGGSINIKSKLNKGTTICFECPLI